MPKFNAQKLQNPVPDPVHFYQPLYKNDASYCGKRGGQKRTTEILKVTCEKCLNELKKSVSNSFETLPENTPVKEHIHVPVTRIKSTEHEKFLFGEPVNLNEIKDTVYGHCVHGNNMVNCDECNSKFNFNE